MISHESFLNNSQSINDNILDQCGYIHFDYNARLF